MPFDNLTLAPKEKLQIAASQAGLKIADLGLLERHKSTEVKRRAPGWAYRHQATLQMALGIGVIAGIVGFVTLQSQGFIVPGLSLAIALGGLVTAALGIPMRGPAHWEERVEADLASVPPRIARAARSLREQLPDVEFRIGELFQHQVKLDPYLIAAQGDARLLLGIWDGEDVIFCA